LMKNSADIKLHKAKLNEKRAKINKSLGHVSEENSHLNNISGYLRRIKPDKLTTKIHLGQNPDGLPIEMYLKERHASNLGSFTFTNLPTVVKNSIIQVCTNNGIDPEMKFSEDVALDCLTEELINEIYTVMLEEIKKHRSANAKPFSKITLTKCRQKRKRESETGERDTKRMRIVEERDIEQVTKDE